MAYAIFELIYGNWIPEIAVLGDGKVKRVGLMEENVRRDTAKFASW